MIDLNLVRVFVTIYETGSVSAAAERLHVSQPSVSYTLARLRQLLGEPLFTRTREGMTPTYFASQLYGKFRNAVSDIEGTIESTRSFNPSTSTRRFRLAMTDIGEVFFLPHIVSAVQQIAPDVELDVVAVDQAKLEEWLGMGKIDAAVCIRSHVPIDTAAEVIFTERYICLASRAHPRLKTKLTMRQYLAERHVMLSPESGHHLVDERLRELGCRRKVMLRVPHFSVLPAVITGSELLVTLPSRMGRMYAAQYDVRVFDLPFSVPAFDVLLRWHEHSGDIVAQRWICQVLRERLSGL